MSDQVMRVIVIQETLNMLRSFAKLKQFLKRSFSHSREPFGMAQGGHFSGIYRKVQLKPLKWDGEGEEERPVEALMILKYGGVLTHAGRKQVFTYSTI
ncbi:hypothetical protein HID58_095711 [Brassica napus]|uniref:Uncharacterized protein n=1 Tax=Brassica napus TaxID=3708 RepID=A0ABQ7X4Y1_BRANA|nr:hypothetical protein HID58_095711 [Brassica napus]